jgi:hypothetical protein
MLILIAGFLTFVVGLIVFGICKDISRRRRPTTKEMIWQNILGAGKKNERFLR